ncbi:signal peptidase I SipW [Oceanobacillus sp. CAU 1775]
MKLKKVFKWVNHLVSTLLIIVLVGVAGIVLMTKFSGGEPEVFGYQIKTVLSGSMEPEIQTGSIIAVRPLESEEKQNLQVDDVITFMETKDKLVTHRIIDVKETGEGAIYTTKGDNNNGPDRQPVLADNVVASYEGFTVPYAGYVASFAQSKNGVLVLLIIPGILMIGYSVVTILLAIRKIDVKQEDKAADPQ